MLEFEKHVPSNAGDPFILHLNIASAEIDGERLTTVDYRSNDPNMVIVPDSPHHWQSAQGMGELVVHRATEVLADISDPLRRGPERQTINPFEHDSLKGLYNDMFPSDL